ncbi:Na/Pi symporter [Desulfitobacterium sp.]|uniref:Na/Pi cotransporter family protein n=1 Tax=Desulfitobacterium sp. TaxID=49981 RepID=UPI002B20B216|nr:Na/Pi symporter [Desulfitobacterium sp.]MEA4902123.1 Na/Pi symporter [Desulfitobacterium sp.]
MSLLLAMLLGLFCLLYGMSILRLGLERFAADAFKRVLDKMTLTPWRGLWSGTAATALLQSSTALSVMTISFVDAGLIPFENALGLILGSNIGTTMTTQLLAFSLDSFIPYILLLGSLGFLFIPNRYRYLALSVFGLGLLFLALHLLKTGMAPLAEIPIVQAFLMQLGDHHFQGVLAGTLLSALLHSSAATTGLVMLLTEGGYLTLPTALAFIFGANIGTCFTAVIASFVTNRAAQRVALFHVLLNVFGVLLFLPLLNPLAYLLEGLGGSLSRQVANAHTVFNLVSSLVVFPFLPLATRFLTRVLK